MFFTRLGSSVVLVILALLTLLVGGPLLAVTLLVISMVAYQELLNACNVHIPGQKISLLELAGYAGILIYYVVLYFIKGEVYQVFAAVFCFMLLLFIYVFSFPKFEANQLMISFFSFVYAPVMFSFVYLTRNLQNGIYIVWMIFISSWISDTFAYVVGMTLGKHKLAPKLSPKKSVEGSLGGIAGAALVGALYGYFVVDKIIPNQKIVLVFAVIGAVGSVISQVGDLAASAIKRNYEIKDYGKLIPGHGGIMDRFVSVIVTAPMFYFFAVLLIK